MAEVTLLQPIIFALLTGVLPALLWLWFWLKEDAHPEPKRLIVAAFFAGVLAIPIVLVLEHLAVSFLPEGVPLITSWAIIEEVIKYLAAYVAAFRAVCIDGTKCLDEPIDPLIYLITVALGFAAVENTLFLVAPFAEGEAVVGLITGNLRFIGATVLHIVASSLIGVAMGLAFYKSRAVKRIAVVIGLFTAIVLHTFFNLSIINNNSAENIFITFGVLWIGAIILLLFFEKIRKIYRSTH
ncbi:MAG: PrsW family glutamic-type intramembrane protease [Candidatus Paceibacterota bacterium]